MINQVEVKNVYKNFGDVKAVDGVSLEISQGQFFSLLGPSGCGKTTSAPKVRPRSHRRWRRPRFCRA